jgi:hypothetical protein
MPYAEKLDDLHGRPMVNVVSGGTFYIHDKEFIHVGEVGEAGFLSRQWKTRSIIFCPERKASFALPSAADARAKQSACLCAGISLQVSFIMSAKRHLRAGRADPTCP